jgi:hypothetical protein
MQEPGTPITELFMKVRQKLRKETGQVPWELSSLEGEFFFVPGKAGKAAEAVKKEVAAPNAELDDEQRKIDEEREKLRKEKELLEQKEALAREKRELEEKKKQIVIDARSSESGGELDDEFRQLEKDEKLLEKARRVLKPESFEAKQKKLEARRSRLEEKKKQIAMGAQPSASTVNEIRRDGRFIAYDNGTVLDTKTNLTWAAKDNGSDINWYDAKKYCEDYRGGGYTDWRMPTQDELAGLYDVRKSRPGACSRGYYIHVATELIDITCFGFWASETRRSTAALFVFLNGTRTWFLQSRDNNPRVLPVRSGK